MNANLIQVTDQLRSFDFDNKKSWNKHPLNDVKMGLYLMILDNSDGLAIKDKNKNNKTDSIGKVVVPEKSISIKFGKFENGFLNRMRGYSKHLHRASEFDFSVFQSVLNKCYCLDLSLIDKIKPKFNPAAIYESFWNRSLHFHFLERGLLAPNQNMRSEYRVIELNKGVCESEFIDENFLDEVSKSIDDSFLIFSKNF